MKTVAAILRDADPLGYEPPRRLQERRLRRQTVEAASHLGDERPQRRIAVATIVALAVIGIPLSSLYSSRTVVDAVAAVRFEVHLAEENAAPGLRQATILGTGRNIYLHSEPIVANGDIVEAHVVPGYSASMFGVALTFNAEGAARMLRATQGHIGRPIAILIDGEVAAAPVVRSPITTSGIISGNFDRTEVERIVGGILGR
jgi:hypothetical protein